MADEHNVHILDWPKESLGMEHHFPKDENFPVTVSFAATAARVVVSTPEEGRLAVNMNMVLQAREVVPLCIRLCEPICAESNYTIFITIFDRPVMTITLRGRTRFYNCREEV